VASSEKSGDLVWAAHPTVSAQVHAHLRLQIVLGHFSPRQRLSENDLAASLGVSRTPVREALGKLQEERLIQIVPQFGTFVAPILVEDVYSNQFVREALECAAILRAAARITPEAANRLRGILDRQRQTQGTDDAFFAADEAMHAELMAIAGEPGAWRVVEAAKLHLDRVRRLAVKSPLKRQSIIDEHETIIENVIRRNAAGATDAMRVHLRGVFASIEPVMQQHPEFFCETAAEARPARHRA
jgi:DNA-binding GntR family transcriptional regulator